MKRKILLITFSFLLIVSLILGNSTISWVYAKVDDIYISLKLFNQVFELIYANYVEHLPSDKLVNNAIEGMVDGLDPHSSFIDSLEHKHMKENFRGKYTGIGIRVSLIDSILTILMPLENTPASRAGIISGDQIIEIDGESTEGFKIKDATKRLRGFAGSKVTITIHRMNEPEPLLFTMIRQKITVRSVKHSFLLEPTIGYIKLSNFNYNSTWELEAALNNLIEEGMEKLILDLRGNEGGLLDQSVQVAGKFLAQNELIVYTKGKVLDNNKKYFVQNSGNYSLPLLVLINKQTASASEIVAGAIQDYDRGLILGERSFGKGLVQRIYTLDDKSALKLTIAKYYTPSGRCIQRDYTDKKEYKKGPNDIENYDNNDNEVFTTKNGRIVHGGGGIAPDILLEKSDNPFIKKLEKRKLFFRFAILQRDSFSSSSLEVDDEMMKKFREYIQEEDITFNEEDWENNKDYLKIAIKHDLLYVTSQQKEAYQLKMTNDEIVQYGLDIFNGEQVLSSELSIILGMN